jgi:cell cycle checkpoint protein
MDAPAAFSAVSTSVRQLYSLLRCIAFAPKAEVQITAAGIRFSVDEARVVQGATMLERNLFSTYTFNPQGDADHLPIFEISMPALLETLQIFGISEAGAASKNQGGGFSSSYTNAFTTPSLGLGGTCRIIYAEVGAPLSITIQEGSVTTTCEINTYEPQGEFNDGNSIPLDRNALCLKIIMRSTWLYDAIAELSGTNPDSVLFNASERSPPYFCLEGQGGPFGDVVVDYMPDSKSEPTPSLPRSKKQPFVTETFSVAAPPRMHGRVKQRYKFDLLKKAGKAMALASKVSMRQDLQGVLSMQFMIELDTATADQKNREGAYGGVPQTNLAKASFVDFRFVPLLDDEDEDEYADTDEEADDT